MALMQAQPIFEKPELICLEPTVGHQLILQQSTLAAIYRFAEGGKPEPDSRDGLAPWFEEFMGYKILPRLTYYTHTRLPGQQFQVVDYLVTFPNAEEMIQFKLQWL